MLAILTGAVLRTVDYKIWFALSNYTIEAESPILERRLWLFFPKDCLKFWPSFIKRSEGLSEFLERDLPVSVKTEMHGLGNFITRIKWLTPWLTIEWQGELWNISRDGKMWALNQEDISGTISSNKINPIWKIPDGANQENDIHFKASLSGVFKSPISTGVMTDFLEEFRGYGWFEAADRIAWERRAGLDLFVLYISNGGQNFEILIQREKYSGQNLGEIISEVYNRLLNEGGSHTIDATYEGKIVLRNL